MKLLIVEDETRMADLLRQGLTEEGHTAMCAFDGAEGLAMAKAYEFDVIILDVMLPKLNGYEVAKRLRSEKIRTPILMLTAKDAVPDVERFPQQFLGFVVAVFYGQSSRVTVHQRQCFRMIGAEDAAPNFQRVVV